MTTPLSSESLDRSMARAVAWNAAARWVSQILSWASTIVIARLLTPYDYGLIGMAGLYLNLAMLISEAGITDAIITLRDLGHRQIAELNSVSLLVGSALVGLTCALAVPLAHFFAAPALRAVIVVASIMYFINGFQVVPRALLRKELRFKLLASIETVRAFSQIFATVLFAWLGFRYWSLVIGNIVSCAVVSLLMLCFRPHGFAWPHFVKLRRELEFSRQVLVSGVAWYAYDNADFGVAGRVLGGTALGNYTVAWTISSAPIEKVANLISGVTPAFFSAVQSDKAQLRRYLHRLTEVLALVTVPASIGLALVADYLVPVLLGPKWYGVIGPLRLLSIFVAARSVTIILPKLLTAVGDTRFVMWVTIGLAIVMSIAFLIGSRWGTEGIAAAWVLAYPPSTIPMYRRVFQKTDMHMREYLSAIMPAVNASGVMTVAVLVARWTLPIAFQSVSGLALLITIGTVSYVGALLVFHRQGISRIVRAILLALKGEQRSERIATIEV
jgi:O-antigen/teichoic acid export membrane protein